MVFSDDGKLDKVVDSNTADKKSNTDTVNNVANTDNNDNFKKSENDSFVKKTHVDDQTAPKMSQPTNTPKTVEEEEMDLNQALKTEQELKKKELEKKKIL